MTTYESNREIEFSYTKHLEEFKLDFKQKIDQTVPLNILVDNLKRYLHLINSNSDDIELLWKALRLYLTKREQWRRKSDVDNRTDYVFGPIVMRAFSYHKIPNSALNVI